MAITYKDAGVDIEAGEDLVRKIKPLVRSTFTPGVLADIGSFGGFFRPDLTGLKDPVLVSSVDGVGTKLKVAFLAGRHNTVGQDLVNHCVNDIAVCGALPLFFLDYFSTGRLSTAVAASVIEGFTIACKENGCALIGGETAEMPDLYNEGEYDLAGCITGIVDKDHIVDGKGIMPGDLLIGLPSTGLHTNGYSLARKVLLGRYSVTDTPDELGGESIGEVLLKVHRLYLKPIRALIDADLAVGLVHVTGGGLPGNTKRILPEGLEADFDYSSWERPPIIRLIQELGEVPEEDLRSALNLGIGLVAVVRRDRKEEAFRILQTIGEQPIHIGSVQQA